MKKKDLERQLGIVQARDELRRTVRARSLEDALADAAPGTDVLITTQAGRFMRATVIDVRHDFGAIDTGNTFAQGPREVTIKLSPQLGMVRDE